MTSLASITDTGSPAATRGTAAFGQDFSGFLRILTTQLRMQDPTSPMDADRFTSQLVEFAGVEQALRTNAGIEQLVALGEAAQATASLQYLGREATVDGSVVALDADRGAAVRYTLDGDAARVRVRILDGDGTPVRELEGVASAGPQMTGWDGTRADGSAAPPGVYRALVEATGAGGEAVPVTTDYRGRVTRVETGTSGMALVIDGVAVPFAAIRAVGALSS